MDYTKGGWHFKEMNAQGFDDHVLKSIPWYEEGHSLIKKLSEFFVQQDDVIYDIGSSTGTLAHHLAGTYAPKKVKVIGLDESHDMVELAAKKFKHENLSFVEADVCSYEFQKSGLVIAYYTLHFLPESKREAVIKKIYASLKKGGAFILFEKVRSEDSTIDSMFNVLLTEFKLEMGQKPDEIVDKTLSLKGILHPMPSERVIQELKSAGFSHAERIFKINSFEGFMGIK